MGTDFVDSGSIHRAIARLSTLTVLASAALIAACGGGSADSSASASAESITLPVEAELPGDIASLQVQPQFHMAPVVLAPPDDADALDNAASARRPPHSQAVDETFGGLSTQRLTLQTIGKAQRMQSLGLHPSAANGTVSPMAAGTLVATYTPAQIRAAYGMPPLPAAGLSPTATQAAQMGAGQTIYIVNAMHNPNVVAELNAFNQRFGLPGCTVRAILTTTTLPMAPASKTEGCVFSVVYSTTTGSMTSTAPKYESGWATEIALDVQWAHATAPMARIVLIETPDASIGSMTNGIKLANAMGAGIVSMSFGAGEGSWTSQVESAFSGANMSYVAATGDWGTQVLWPSVSPRVVAVGGTSLTYSGSGTRQEIGWSQTGGGISLYTATPAYQANTVPGMGTMAKRAVADVGFNADPSTGQYVAIMPPGGSTVSWSSVGGTSLSTPQWAGLTAAANALRAMASKPALGTPHAMLYGQIASVPGTYASVFSDIKAGNNGGCTICTAKVGFDALTGLGTPNVGALLSALAGTSAPATPPVVNSATLTGTAGTALSFNVSVVASNPVTYTLTGAPSGMTISTGGTVNWLKPVAGTYAVSVSAKDNSTGLSGQGTYTIIIKAAAAAPVVSSGSVTSVAGKALTFTATVKASNAVNLSLSGAPTGMSISSAGVVSWASPVAGAYQVTVNAQDKVNGLTGKGTYAVTITKPLAPPTITATALSGTAGKALSGSFQVADANGYGMSVSISGFPSGMTFALSGKSIVINWPKPATGKYTLTITVVNSAGARAQTTQPITITAQ